MLKQQTNKKSSMIALLCVAGVLLLVTLLENMSLIFPKVPAILLPTSQLFTVLKKGAVYSLVAVSMNLLNGFTGLFSLGQAGFMLLGAYTYAILMVPMAVKDQVYYLFDGSAVKFSLLDMFQSIFGAAGFGSGVALVLAVLLALILAGCVAALFAYLIGLPVLRLKSDYLAIATLGFAEIIRAIFQWQVLGPVTNGANMIKSFPTFSSFNIKGANGSTVLYLSTFVPFLIVAGCIIVIVMLVNSTYGRAFKAIRDDEVAAEAMGINLAKHKMLSFVTSSFFAGVSGATMAMVLSIAQANNYKVAMTYEILLMVVLGGIGSISGSVIGSMLFVAASEWWLRGLDSGKFLGIEAPGVFRNGFRLVVFSVVIMVVVLFFRKGIMGDRELPQVIAGWKEKVRAKKAAKQEVTSK